MLSLNIPKEITIRTGKNWIQIKGPLGSILKKKSDKIKFYFDKDSHKLFLLDKESKNKHFYLSIINKLIWGLYKGFGIKLNLIGIGYKVSVENNQLILKLGYSHDIIYDIPKDITISIVPKQKNLTILIFGNNHQKVKQVAAEIRGLKSPEPYKGKGIRYFDEVVKLKQGKKN